MCITHHFACETFTVFNNFLSEAKWRFKPYNFITLIFRIFHRPGKEIDYIFVCCSLSKMVARKTNSAKQLSQPTNKLKPHSLHEWQHRRRRYLNFYKDLRIDMSCEQECNRHFSCFFFHVFSFLFVCSITILSSCSIS